MATRASLQQSPAVQAQATNQLSDRSDRQGEKTTGPVPSQMLSAVSTMVATMMTT